MIAMLKIYSFLIGALLLAVGFAFLATPWMAKALYPAAMWLAGAGQSYGDWVAAQ